MTLVDGHVMLYDLNEGCSEARVVVVIVGVVVVFVID